jgi:hypothetical protein
MLLGREQLIEELPIVLLVTFYFRIVALGIFSLMPAILTCAV